MATRHEVDFTDEAKDDLREMRPFDRQRIVTAIEQHLRFAPHAVSRSRIKRMEKPFWSEFRLRVSEFRVYYNVDEAQGIVNVLRILQKETGQTPEVPP